MDNKKYQVASIGLVRQTAALEGLFQVRTIHVFLGKELMMLLMQYYTSYFILMQIQHK